MESFRGPQTQVLRVKPSARLSRSWNLGPESETQCPFIEVLKPRSSEPNTEVLTPTVLRAKCSNAGSQALADCVRPSRVPTSECLWQYELSVKSCPLGPELHPSIDASSLHGCCRQSNEILLNKGMKYWDSGFSARGAKTFIATVHIAGAVISWRRSEKERTGQSQFSTQFAAKLSFMPLEAQGTCFLKPHPLCDQTGEFGSVFSWLYG